MKGLTYRQLETSREVRLWIKDVIFPVAIIGCLVYSKRDAIKEKGNELINKFKAKHE